MKIYSGIDEAGLGPILGPFCAAVTTFKSPEPLKELLEDQQKKLFYVDDSKKVFQGKYGFKRLELNVLSFYHALYNELPVSFNSFIPTLTSIWNNQNIPLPIQANQEEILNRSNDIKSLFKNRGIELLNIKRTCVSPTNFNKLLDIWDNKSIACQKIMNPLLLTATDLNTQSSITVDKQGGRKFYKEYLQELIPGNKIMIIKEEDTHSHYTLGNIDIHFKAKADSSDFTVALSSMFSKYMRELAMLSFNMYWDKKLPGIKRTAGYYTDGMRFIDDLRISNQLPADLDILIRKK